MKIFRLDNFFLEVIYVSCDNPVYCLIQLSVKKNGSVLFIWVKNKIINILSAYVMVLIFVNLYKIDNNND